MSKRLHIRKPSVFLPELTDEQITEACRLLTAYEVATIPLEDTYTEPYSDAYTAYIHELMEQYKTGTITPTKVPMGWQYYTRRGIAAVLIAALLAGIAMPDKVMAGYRWLVEVVEEFLEDRTRYRYTSNVDEDVEFVPMKFGYLPEGMEILEIIEQKDRVKWIFISSNKDKTYFQITQKLLTNTVKRVYGSNTELYYTEIVLLNDSTVKIIKEIDKISFYFIYAPYHVTGQTDLSKEELIEILENIEYK